MSDLVATELLLSADEARRLTDRIKVGIEAVWLLLAEAYEGKAWLSLGYSSWDDYRTREFGNARLQIPREDRSEVVGSLRDAGMSIRAIAETTGASTQTVQRDLNERQVYQITTPATAPDLAPTTPATPPGFLDELTAESVDGWLAETIDDSDDRPTVHHVEARRIEPQPAPRVTGLDGKSYRATTPAAAEKPRRQPLGDAAEKAGWEFRRVVERLERIVADDRIEANKDQVAAHLVGHLSYAVEVCQDLLDRLDHQNNQNNEEY